MQLPRRSYYYKSKEKPCDKALEARRADICLELSGYGYRRVTKQLQREGWIVNHKKVARIMRDKSWSCRSRKKKWMTTTNSDHGFQISMGRKANPYDNAYAESFIKTLKSEEVQLWEYLTIEDVERTIPYFIEEVYNQKRLHSSLGHRPPCEFETMMMSTQNPCHSTQITTL